MNSKEKIALNEFNNAALNQIATAMTNVRNHLFVKCFRETGDFTTFFKCYNPIVDKLRNLEMEHLMLERYTRENYDKCIKEGGSRLECKKIQHADFMRFLGPITEEYKNMEVELED